MKNPFTVLGVSPNATNEEIKNAYKRLAKKYHPDADPDNPEALKKMMEINAAYHDLQTFSAESFFDDATSNSASSTDFHYSNRYSDDDIYYDTYDEDNTKKPSSLFTNVSSYFKTYIQFINRHYFAIGFSLLLIVAFITLYSNNLLFSKPNLEASTTSQTTIDTVSSSNIADDNLKVHQPQENEPKMAMDGQHP